MTSRNSTSKDHPLHLAIAQELQKRLDGRWELLRDPACGGDHNLPLFVGAVKRNDTRMCNVDLLVVLGDAVKVIVEIEESGFLPTKICGKFLQSALATHLIHDSQQKKAVRYAARVLFVQVLDGSKCLKSGGGKRRQCELIEKQIRRVLPLTGRKANGIKDYCLFFVQGVDDHAGLESIGAAVSQAVLRGGVEDVGSC